MIDFWKNSNI